MAAKILRLLCLFCAATVVGSSAQTLTTLVAFNGSDGAYPSSGVVQGSDGNFYGTTYLGGANALGSVFKISPTGQLTTLYSFCSQSNCADGSQPLAPLVQGADGSFYGTTFFRGLYGGGTIFKISPTGNFTTVYNFCNGGFCTDGSGPAGGVVAGSDGKFYGTTVGGGNGSGTIFQFNPAVGLTTLYRFCEQSGCPDGSAPGSALVQGMDGSFYGTTESGGNSGGSPTSGTVFKITTGGVFTQLYRFCSQTNCTDGGGPYAGLVQGPDGNFYGTTAFGGAPADCPSGCGTIFKITPAGSLTTLHKFCSQGSCADGSRPMGPVVQATDGNFYGTTQNGGATADGTIFEISPTGNLTTLYTFCAQGGSPCPDGQAPEGALSFASDGNFYGTTYGGGASADGTVFKFSAGITLSAVQFVPVTPCRLVDTRQTQNPIQGGTFQDFSVPQLGGCNIPANAAAYSLNVTVLPHGQLGYLTIWPAGRSQPTVSTMNSLDGRIKANAAIVPAGASGAVSAYATNTTDMVLDIDGYFATGSPSTLEFYPLTPCRVLDTRNPVGPLGGPYLTSGQERDFPVLSSNCNIPSSAQAYSMNFTVVPYQGQGSGYLTVWPKGSQRPVVSTLNNLTATIVANAAIVPAGTGGDIAAYSSGNTQLVGDIDGYFAPAGTGGLSLYPTAPCRALDTRQSGGAFSNELTVNVVGSVCAPPSSAKAYVFNATVVPEPAFGYLTLWPDGENRPVVSTLDAIDGAITSNMAIVPTNNGMIDAYASGLTQLVLDISSYFAP